MSRQSPSVLWLTLENGSGETSRMGVTYEHPLFAVGLGWTEAGALVSGDTIRDSNLRELTVIRSELDRTPQLVHNLEIADAHTYFTGELEAWGHNGIQENRTSGNNFRDMVFDYLDSQCPGRYVKEVFVRTPLGARFVDIASVDQVKSGIPSEIFECKLNSAKRSKKQKEKDKWISDQGAVSHEVTGSN